MQLFPFKPRTDATALGRELVACLREEPAALAARIGAWTPAAADALVGQADAHSVAPLLRRRLLAHGLFAALPAPARARLDGVHVESAARAMARYRELDRLLERCTAVAVPVIALKGIYLAKAVYDDPALRPMADMDLLFRVEDLEQVQAVLVDLGYTRPDLSRPVADYAGIHLPPFTRDGGGRIEVHRAIESPTAPFALDLDGIWRRARPWSADKSTLMALSREDLLLHLCLHSMYQHSSRIGLVALVDMERLIRREPPDWDRLLARADAWRAQTPAYLGLALASRLVGAEVPVHVLAALSPAEDGEAAVRIAEQTLLATRLADRQVDRLRQYYQGRLTELRALPGAKARLAFVSSRIFPDRATLEHRYPRWAGSRWIRLLYLFYWATVAGRFLRGMRLDGWRQGAVMSNRDRRWFG